MALSNLNKIFDDFRKCFVEATPEEIVRQKWLKILTEDKGFPKSLIAVEKTVKDCALSGKSEGIPHRRIDIVCFAKDIHQVHELYPLLLIECKEGKIGEKAMRQLIGYNDFINAYFLGLANSHEFLLGYYHRDKKSYQFFSTLPTYVQLLNVLTHERL